MKRTPLRSGSAAHLNTRLVRREADFLAAEQLAVECEAAGQRDFCAGSDVPKGDANEIVGSGAGDGSTRHLVQRHAGLAVVEELGTARTINVESAAALDAQQDVGVDDGVESDFAADRRRNRRRLGAMETADIGASPVEACGRGRYFGTSGVTSKSEATAGRVSVAMRTAK